MQATQKTLSDVIKTHSSKIYIGSCTLHIQNIILYHSTRLLEKTYNLPVKGITDSSHKTEQILVFSRIEKLTRDQSCKI